MGPGSKSEAVFAMTVSLTWRDCDPRPSHRPGYKQYGDDLETWKATCRQHESGQGRKNQGLWASSRKAWTQARVPSSRLFGVGVQGHCNYRQFYPVSPSVFLLLLARPPLIRGATWARCGLA